MKDEQLYCDAPECDDPENPGFPRPVGGHGKGKCSTHMKQLQRTGRTVPIAEKLNPEARAIAAGTAMLEADGDDDYHRHRRAWLAASREMGDHERRAAIKKALAAARANGKRIGRPPKLNTEKLSRLLEAGAAQPKHLAVVLEVSESTVRRELSKRGVLPTRVSAPRPRARRGSG